MGPISFWNEHVLLLRLFQKRLILVWMASWLVGLCAHRPIAIAYSCSFVFHVNYDALLTRPQLSQVSLLPSASLSWQWHCCHILAVPISPLENPNSSVITTDYAEDKPWIGQLGDQPGNQIKQHRNRVGTYSNQEFYGTMFWEMKTRPNPRDFGILVIAREPRFVCLSGIQKTTNNHWYPLVN